MYVEKNNPRFMVLPLIPVGSISLLKIELLAINITYVILAINLP